MKEYPLAMSPIMARAMLANRKWQTRRLSAPRYAVGDVVWIQECYKLRTPDDHLGGPPSARVECVYMANDERRIVQLTDAEFLKLTRRKTAKERPTSARFMYKSLSRIRRRITAIRSERLNDITDQDAWAEGISTDDDFNKPLAALANVCSMFPKSEIRTLTDSYLFQRCIREASPDYGKIVWTNARGVYSALWECINGPGSWYANPIVWAITFER